MREIELTKGYVALVDDEDYERINCYLWQAMSTRSTAYAVRQLARSTKPLLMHNAILPPVEGKEINHKNYDGLDNRKENLEHLSHSENTRHGRHKLGRSGQRGISWNKNRSRWYVKTTIYYQCISGGSFEHLNDAIEARDKLFKEYELSIPVSQQLSTQKETVL